MQQLPGISPIERLVNRVAEPKQEGEKSMERLRKTDPEEVWALWLQFLAERKIRKDGEKSPRLERLQSKLVELHESLTDDQKQTLRERVEAIGTEDVTLLQEAGEGIAKYTAAFHQRATLRTEIARIDAERFTRNGDMDSDEFEAIEEADARASLKKVDKDLNFMEYLTHLTKESSALAIHIAAERVKRYAKELHETGFAITPSREKLMDKIAQMLLTSRRPVFLSGVSGGGKTAMIRAIARQLTGREPFEANEAAKEDIRLLYGVRLMDEHNNAYIEYGPLGRAMTGKATSKEKENGKGGIFYLDEANGLRASDLRELIKLLSGKKPGDTVQFSALGGHDVVIAPGFRFVMAGNLKSAKHSDRTELPPEVVRDMEPIDIPAMPQHETYQLMLAELMDSNGRIRVSADQLSPFRTAQQNANGTFLLSEDPAKASGGGLWRFSKLVSLIQDAFANEDPSKSRLFTATLDIGKALSWVKEYRRIGQREGEKLGDFLRKKYKEWAENPQYSEEDRATLNTLFSDINGGILDIFGEDILKVNAALPEVQSVMRPSELPMSTRDIGLSATRALIFVAPEKQKSPEPGIFLHATNKDGEDIQYTSESFENLMVGKKYALHSSPGNVYIFQGLDSTPRKNLVFLLEKQQFSEKFTSDSASRFTLAPEPVPPTRTERPLGVAEREMKQLFGKYFLGIEAAEKTCSIDGGKKKLFTLSPAEKQQASEALRAKLAEPDVKRFVDQLNADLVEKEKWMLVYVPQKNIPGFIADDGTLSTVLKPLALSSLAQILSKDAHRQVPPVNLVYDAEVRSQSTGFFGKNIFATEQIPPGWHFVSKTVLAGTTSKIIADQKTALFTEAARLQFAPGKWKQTHPALRFFALISNFKNNGERLMQNVYDRSDVATASGHFAHVGNFVADGLFVVGNDDGAFSHVGASFAR